MYVYFFLFLFPAMTSARFFYKRNAVWFHFFTKEQFIFTIFIFSNIWLFFKKHIFIICYYYLFRCYFNIFYLKKNDFENLNIYK